MLPIHLENHHIMQIMWFWVRDLIVLEKILKGEANQGILSLEEIEKFPPSERYQFYNDHPMHRCSKIKSIITQTGCPYTCSYCYNSSKLDSIELPIAEDKREKMKDALGPSWRLFPKVQRSVDEIIDEVYNILEVSPETDRIYFQDDIFGTDLKRLEEFSKKYPKIWIPFHGQMRFEYLDPQKDHGKKRTDLLKASWCDGLTFAIESAIPAIREEVLHRKMNQDIMFDVFENIHKLWFRVRTEQMIGLPYWATKTETPVWLEADLETLKLNVQLKEETWLPTMAWSSTFAPYIGTHLGKYCLKHGFYSNMNEDIPVSFFEKSVLHFPKQWFWPDLSKDTRWVWMNKEERIVHQDKLSILQNLFTTWASIPKDTY